MSPTFRLATLEIGRVFPLRVTVTSMRGPTKSKVALSAGLGAKVRSGNVQRHGSSTLQIIRSIESKILTAFPFFEFFTTWTNALTEN